jgi:hypothetical protein
MRPKALVAAGIAASAAALAFLFTSPAHHDTQPAVHKPRAPNLSWSQLPQPSDDASVPVSAPVLDPVASPAAPVQEAIVMQDGTVVQAARRMRDGNAPARER